MCGAPAMHYQVTVSQASLESTFLFQAVPNYGHNNLTYSCGKCAWTDIRISGESHEWKQRYSRESTLFVYKSDLNWPISARNIQVFKGMCSSCTLRFPTRGTIFWNVLSVFPHKHSAGFHFKNICYWNEWFLNVNNTLMCVRVACSH
jgi:hypothetical protein